LFIPKEFSMPPLPPELRVAIRKVGDQYLAVTERANGDEICSNTFKHDPDKLVHLEPRWMLERGARLPAEALKTNEATANHPPDDKLLIDYGQRLYSYLFGDGQRCATSFSSTMLIAARPASRCACIPKPPRCGVCRGSICTTARNF
jgi:hypothetical protein